MKSKIIIAIVFFMFGFVTHLWLERANNSEAIDRVAVKPEEFDRDMFQNYRPFLNSAEDVEKNLDLNIKETEDDNYVYYILPIDKAAKNSKLNVEVKDGYIHITHEQSDEGFNSSSEQVFPIASNLDEKKSEVLNENNKIVIKIPKKVK